MHGANLQLDYEPQHPQKQSKGEQTQAATAAPAASKANVPQHNINTKEKTNTKDVLEVILDVAHEITGAEMETNVPLMSSGLDSLSAVEFVNALSTRLSVDVPPTALFDHPTLDSIASFLARELAHNTVADFPSSLEGAQEMAQVLVDTNGVEKRTVNIVA